MNHRHCAAPRLLVELELFAQLFKAALLRRRLPVGVRRRLLQQSGEEAHQPLRTAVRARIKTDQECAWRPITLSTLALAIRLLCASCTSASRSRTLIASSASSCRSSAS